MTDDRKALDDLIAMLASVEIQDGCAVFNHSAEEIGIEVMEHHRAVLAALRVVDHIEQLRADYASVHILCDNDDATYRSEAVAIEVSAEWTGWDPKRFYGEDVAQCLAAAVQAKAEYKP